MCVCDAIVWCPTMFLGDCTMLADDAYDAYPSKWKTNSEKIYGRSFTWHGTLGATMHMSNTRQAIYEYRPCKGVTVRTASNQLLPTLEIRKASFGNFPRQSQRFVPE